MRILGAILAGGQARRFGSNKALATLHGEPLIAHAARALDPQVAEVAVCGGAPLLPDRLHLPDRPAPGLGPLGGLAAALAHARQHGFDGVVSVGCDTPLLPDDLVARLRAPGGASFLEAMPLIGWWPGALAPTLDAFVATDPRRSLRGWGTAAGATPLALPRPIPNINTPGDLAALLR
ncbi:molybdenum cofactor guanylyltransferase [Sphingomonas desiccabilis]|uniref:Molybdenum cofactor guanylyltransferase n=1 Tax=Sphingomonas desiccabilis TaxID=429134 RepID=A0A4Q2ILT7_9SPHN|nr:NTP transferase domain-containing protein [Sphingomonas desiccabilis]MBB3912080.1 molybdopterin-guanine dinucleotide biosynthesis protein A [Sphingomonas desiccabilis]RXZ30250.1 molybdenum cofactor guanylyltransferase [Sphingomonas desiccabilis]